MLVKWGQPRESDEAQIARRCPLVRNRVRAALLDARDRKTLIDRDSRTLQEMAASPDIGRMPAPTAILLARYGGLDIAAASEKLARAGELDAAAHRLAEAVGGRDAAVPFGLFNDRALSMLAEAARAAALSGDVDRAGRLSERFEEARLAVEEAETYNLDRKQHALNMIVRLQDAFRM